MPEIALNWIDVVTVFAYLIAVIAHGLWVSRGNVTSHDYFLAGRRIPWYLIGLSLFASNMSGASFVGLMGASYDHGVVVFNYEWTAAAVLIFFAVFMVPYFLRSRIFTVPEYLQHRYGTAPRMAYSVFTLLAILFIDTAGALYAGGLVITVLFPQLGLWQAVALLALLAGVYTILGGLSAVVVTDAVQAVLLIFGAALIFVFGLQAVGGWEAMLARIEPSRLELIKPMGDPFLPWPGILGVLLLGFYYWTLNQFVVQRVLGARSLDDARKGALLAGLLKIPNVFIMILPGVFAVLLYPGLSNPDLVFPTLAFELLPVGLRGLILTALVAAIMSSLDSALNAAATLFTMDFIKPLRPATGERTLVRIGRWVTVTVMVLAALYAPLIRSFENLFQYFQSVLAYVVPAVVAVYLGGMFWWRLNARGAFWTLIAGLVLGASLFVVKEVTGLWTQWGLPAIHFTIMAVLMLVLMLALHAVISVLSERPRRESVAETVFSREHHGRDLFPRAHWYRDFRWQAAALTALSAVVIAYFW